MFPKPEPRLTVDQLFMMRGETDCTVHRAIRTLGELAHDASNDGNDDLAVMYIDGALALGGPLIQALGDRTAGSVLSTIYDRRKWVEERQRLRKVVAARRLSYDNSTTRMGPQRRRELEAAEQKLREHEQ